ncbi:MAG: restriction endonuclease subunit S [Bacillus sp. (in: Bacteria)]|nr:restriction endonuclease subunit S [Bacillus sp. (in: firmicutes)]MCM1427073.1 restriction endonuclease subunit S [Eubacterium sp.]
MELPIPAIDKQREIVNSYKVITDRIELKRKINDNLDVQISSLYKEYFIIPSTDELPSGWYSKLIEDCNFDISDGNYSSKYPKYNEFVPRGIPFIRGTDFIGKYISTQDVLHITPEMHADLQKGHTKSGDILISTRGEIGKIAFVPETLVDANINSQLVRINGNGVLPRVYLAYTLLSEPVKNEIKSLITGSVQEQLPIGKIKKVHILFPDVQNLDKFCKQTTPMLATILENEHEIVLLLIIQEILLETLSRC